MGLSEDERLDVATELLAEVRRRAERVQRGESQSVTWDEAKRQVLGRLQAR
jgi:hypothetical protein